MSERLNTILSPRVRSTLLAVVFALAFFKFAAVVHDHYPIQKWLFWRYARVWGLAMLWTLACLAAGHLLLRRGVRQLAPILEHLVLSFGLGLFSFFLLMVLSGLLHLYGPALFVALPLAMIAAGARPAWRYARRLARHLRFARSRCAEPPKWWTLPLLLTGLTGTLAVYLPALLPDNAAFDACWYHMPIAEHYVAAGGIVPFKEGWHLGAFPQLASVLYTWAFLQPWGLLFDRVELCAHLEFVVFLWTLASIPLLVRQLLPRSRASWSWLAVYLFPGLYVYDSSLLVGADHIAAFWAVPLYVAFLRTWKRFDLRWAALTAVFLAGALNTKYTAFSLAAGPLAALVARAGWLSLAAARRRIPGLTRSMVWAGFGAFVLTAVVLTAPHWAKNHVFYGDPLYPALWRNLHVHPWTADSAIRYSPDLWAPTRDLAGVWESLAALWTFSFAPHDWEQFHHKVPVFGSLFTLTLLGLPLLRGTRRTWGLAAITLAGVFAWYTVSHQDRYLQVLVPWMAACTAAVLMLAWRTGWIARAGVIPLVGIQLVWGIGVYFIPSHNMLFQHPVKVLLDFGGAWFRNNYDERLERFQAPSMLGRLLDRNQHVVLVHEKLNHLGLRARSVSDNARFQSGISYGRLGSPREVWELFRGLEITHLMSAQQSEGSDSYAADLVFWDFAQRYTHSKRTAGNLSLSVMPQLPPPEQPFGDIVAFFACRNDLANGLYHLRDLNLYPRSPATRPFEPAQSQELESQLLRADFLIDDSTCHSALPLRSMSEFVQLTRRGPEVLYVRKTSP